MIRGDGQLRTVADIDDVVVSVDADGTPVQVRTLGKAQVGAALPHGVVTRDGKGEAVTGTVMMLIGQNSRDVVHAVKAKIAQLKRELPKGVRIDTVYDRASFIDRTLKTVGSNLVEGALLVGLVILVFLRSWRASLLVTLGIPVVDADRAVRHDPARRHRQPDVARRDRLRPAGRRSDRHGRGADRAPRAAARDRTKPTRASSPTDCARSRGRSRSRC